MIKHNYNVIALAIGLAVFGGAYAENMSKDSYNAGKDKIGADYKAAKSGCASLSGNAEDICIAEAKSVQKIARADLKAEYKPTRTSRYEANVARAEADYAVAKERCDDLAGNAKDVCVKEAKAMRTTGKADAKAQIKVSDANASASKTAAKAREQADGKVTEARDTASDDKRDAEFGVAKEKCDTFAGDAKDQCLGQAKLRFGKS